MKKHEIAVFIENEEMLQQARKLIDKYGEEIDDANFNSLIKTPEYNFISKWRMDGKWRIGNSDRIKVTLPQLEQILKNQ